MFQEPKFILSAILCDKDFYGDNEFSIQLEWLKVKLPQAADIKNSWQHHQLIIF